MIIGGRAHNVEQAEQIGRAGLAFAEISVTDPRKFYTSELSELKRIQQAHGLSYLAHGPEEGNAWEPDVLRRKLLPLVVSLLDCLSELSVPLLTIHFWLDGRFMDKRVLEEKLEILGEMTRHADGRGVQLCVENLSERFSDFAPAFEAIAHLGMTLDIGHGELLSEVNTAHDFSRNCLEQICHIHVHDNRGGDSPEHDLHLPLGEGVIDFESILKDLKDRGYDKTITVEVAPGQAAACKKIVEAIWYRG